MKRLSGFVLIVVVAVMLLAVAAYRVSIAGSPPPADDRPPHKPWVVVARPHRGAMERTITLPGDLVGYYQAALYAKVTGYLKSISVDKGDSVKAGQVLAVIEVPELRQRLDRAKANLEIKRLTYSRLLDVRKSDPRLLALQDVDIARAKYQEAKAKVDELNAIDSYTRITAPFNGVITARFVDPGALIHAGGQRTMTASMQSGERPGAAAAPVVSIARMDKLRIYVYVPQGEVDLVHRGMAATITVHGIQGLKVSGTVARFSHSLDLATRSMLTEVDLENPKGSLYPGMYADVRLVLERHPNALSLPLSAVGGNHSHYVLIVRHGRIKKAPVTLGIDNGRHVEITSGLAGNNLVVCNINNSLRPGEKVQYAFQTSPAKSFALADNAPA